MVTMPNGDGVPPPRPGGPGVKPPMKKSTRNWLIIGGLGAAAIAVYMVMRARSSAGSGIDPSTGQPYDQSGYSGAYGTTPSLYGYVDPTTGAFISGAGAQQSVLQPTTNASWAQEVEAFMAQQGWDPIAVGAAIGKYLTGQHLTADQQSIVAAALAFFGQPPQGAPPIQGGGGGQGGGQGGGGIQHYRNLRVKHNETLGQFAKEHHWTQATLRAVEKIMHMTARTKLHKGQYIIRPIGDSSNTPKQG